MVSAYACLLILVAERGLGNDLRLGCFEIRHKLVNGYRVETKFGARWQGLDSLFADDNLVCPFTIMTSLHGRRSPRPAVITLRSDLLLL